MVEEAVKKALQPGETKPQPITQENIEALITDSVAKAIEPILKARGLPSNLDGSGSIEKAEEPHYMAGIF